VEPSCPLCGSPFGGFWFDQSGWKRKFDEPILCRTGESSSPCTTRQPQHFACPCARQVSVRDRHKMLLRLRCRRRQFPLPFTSNGDVGPSSLEEQLLKKTNMISCPSVGRHIGRLSRLNETAKTNAPMSESGQNRKNSVRANVFRVGPESGHRSTQSACRKRANSCLDETFRNPRRQGAPKDRGHDRGGG
jgi:hypothetical protein